MKGVSIVNRIVAGAVAALGFSSLVPSIASARVDIVIGVGIAPPPPPAPVVVLQYDSYCVGFRQNLYDADWRLRNAQIDEWHAQEALDVARHHEGEIAVNVEDHEAIVAQFQQKVADSDAALMAARMAAGKASEDAADARARVANFEKRARLAHEDLDAAKTVHDNEGVADAEKRIRNNEAAAGVAATDLHAAEGRLADLQAAEAAAAALNDTRTQLADAKANLPQWREDLNLAHDQMFAAQQHLDGAIQSVGVALHDRDEALWLLHRDEIFAGRSTFEGSGFRIDLGVWGGRMPSDIEVVHAYYVHPVGYWVERPVEIQSRVVEIDGIVEIGRVRDIQRVHEGARFVEVDRIERSVPMERRREYFQKVTVERQRLVAERTERASAVAEHRAPRIPESERAEARATVAQAHAQAKATQITANANAKAAVTEARADAKAEQIKTKADTNAKVAEAKADAKSEKIESQAKVADAKATAKADKIQDQTKVADAKATAKSEQIKSTASAKATPAPQPRADAKGKATASSTASADASRGGSSTSSRSPRGGKATADSSRSSGSRDPRKKSKDAQASVDPFSR